MFCIPGYGKRLDGPGATNPAAGPDPPQPPPAGADTNTTSRKRWGTGKMLEDKCLGAFLGVKKNQKTAGGHLSTFVAQFKNKPQFNRIYACERSEM